MDSKKQTEDTVVIKETGKAAAVKKAPAKKTAKAASDAAASAGRKAADGTKKAATGAKKAAAGTKKTAAASRKAPAAKKTVSPEVSVQSLLGGEISIDEIIRRVNEKVGGAAHDTFKIYIKSEENRAYYVADDKTGYVELW